MMGVLVRSAGGGCGHVEPSSLLGGRRRDGRRMRRCRGTRPDRGVRRRGRQAGKYRQRLPVPGDGIVVATPSGPNRYSFSQTEIAASSILTCRPPRCGPTTMVRGWPDRQARSAWRSSPRRDAARGTAISCATYPSWIPVDTRLTPLGNQVRLMTHLHGGFVAADSDGNPAVTPKVRTR